MIDAALGEHLPVLLGSGALAAGGVMGVIRGYKWLLKEIRAAITEALEHHQETESEWQRGIERRLDAIEEKVDRLMQR